MKKLFLLTSMLAFAAAAQDVIDIPTIWACKDGKPVAVQILVPPGVTTIIAQVPYEDCAKQHPAKPAPIPRPPRAPASRST